MEKKIKVIDITKKEPAKTPSFNSFHNSSQEKIKIEHKKEVQDFKQKEEEVKRELFVKKEPAIISRVDDERHSHEKHGHERKEGKHHKEEKSKFYFLLAIFIILSVALIYLAIFILPRAEIRLSAKKAVWPGETTPYSNSIIINPKIAEVDVANRQIPSATFSQKKNLTISWPASQEKYVEQKATGVMTVFNSYSSASQILVAGTRFQSPDGKIFKLKEQITVPGAQVEAGKITPSSIEADVIADQAGDTYNIGAANFTIPGFLGTDKYEKFYGKSKDAMKGGFVGQGKYATQEDIKKAKESAEAQIKEALRAFLYAQINGEQFKVIGGEDNLDIIKEVVNTNVDNKGNFSVFIEAEGSIKVFKVEDFLRLMSEMAKQQITNGSEYELKTYKVEYGAIFEDSKNNVTTLPVQFIGDFYKPIDPEIFKGGILGKAERDLRMTILSSSNIDKADVSFWPFWVKSVPKNDNRVKVLVEYK